MTKIFKWLLTFISLLVGLLLITWLSTPLWLNQLINYYIAGYGLHLNTNKITVHWPARLQIQNASLINNNTPLFKAEQLTLALHFFTADHKPIELATTIDKSQQFPLDVILHRCIQTSISWQ